MFEHLDASLPSVGLQVIVAIVILLFCALIAAGAAIGGVVGVAGVEDGLGTIFGLHRTCWPMLSYAQLKCALWMRNLSWT